MRAASASAPVEASAAPSQSDGSAAAAAAPWPASASSCSSISASARVSLVPTKRSQTWPAATIASRSSRAERHSKELPAQEWSCSSSR